MVHAAAGRGRREGRDKARAEDVPVIVCRVERPSRVVPGVPRDGAQPLEDPGRGLDQVLVERPGRASPAAPAGVHVGVVVVVVVRCRPSLARAPFTRSFDVIVVIAVIVVVVVVVSIVVVEEKRITKKPPKPR